jgi:hypothetical protein
LHTTLVLSITGVSRDNKGSAGCTILLHNATAAFAAGKPARFINNSADDQGPALKAQLANVTFHGPLTMASNSGGSAGGAMYLELSDVTFNAAANMANNRLRACSEVSRTTPKASVTAPAKAS